MAEVIKPQAEDNSRATVRRTDGPCEADRRAKWSSNQKTMTACRTGWVSWESEQKWTNVAWLYVSWPELWEVMEPREMFIFQIQVSKKMVTRLAKTISTEGKLSSD